MSPKTIAHVSTGFTLGVIAVNVIRPGLGLDSLIHLSIAWLWVQLGYAILLTLWVKRGNR
jgi:hypothetical protein